MAGGEKRKRKITIKGVLRLVGDVSDYMLPMDWVSVYRRAFAPKYFDLEDYFPSDVHRTVARLERKGWVEKKEVSGEMVVALTEKGKKQLLVFNLETLTPKTDKWDGKWRMVFFDIESKSNHLRDKLRRYLQKMGFKQYQESVWVIPFDCDNEIKYIREALNVPHAIKLAVVESLENDEDLRQWFGVERE